MPVTVTDHEGAEHRHPTANAPIAEPDGRLIVAVAGTGQTIAVYPANAWRRAVAVDDEVAEPVELYVPVAAHVAWDGTKLRALYLYPHDGEVGSEQHPDGSGRPLTIEDVRAERDEGDVPGEVEHPDGHRCSTLHVEESPGPMLAETDPELIRKLRKAGDRWGPLGVALAAVQLTDPRVVVAHLAGSDVRAEPPYGEVEATLATYRREVDEQTARAEQEHAARLRAERLLAQQQQATERLREHLDAQRARAERAEGLTREAESHPTSIPAPRNLDLAQHPLALRVFAPGLVTFDGQVLRIEYDGGGYDAAARIEPVLPTARQLLDDHRRRQAEPGLRPVAEEPRRPRLDYFPADALLLTYPEVRRLLALHLEQCGADDAARAMREGETPLRLSEVLGS